MKLSSLLAGATLLVPMLGHAQRLIGYYSRVRYNSIPLSLLRFDRIA